MLVSSCQDWMTSCKVRLKSDKLLGSAENNWVRSMVCVIQKFRPDALMGSSAFKTYDMPEQQGCPESHGSVPCQFLKKYLTWYYSQTKSTFCRRGSPALVHFQLFSCSEAGEVLRDLREATPHLWGWKRGGREGCRRGRRVARLRPSFQSMWYQWTDLSCALTDTTSPGAMPVPSQLAPLCSPGQRTSHL